MQEGISYIAGAELPCVIVDVVRGGPGLGNIAPEQSDYFCIVKGGGHGCYRNIVLAPSSVQEMFDLTVLAFDLADRYRNPVIIMTDGYVGQMMEPLDIKMRNIEQPEKDWAVKGNAETKKNVITSIFLESDVLEAHVNKLEAKYQLAQELETRCEEYLTEDADVLLIGFGIVSRVLRSTVDQLRAQGLKAGLFRPITLWPYPVARALQNCGAREVGNGSGAEHRNDAGRREADAQRYRAGGVLWTYRRQCALGGRNYRAGVFAHVSLGVGRRRNCERLRSYP